MGSYPARASWRLMFSAAGVTRRNGLNVCQRKGGAAHVYSNRQSE